MELEEQFKRELFSTLHQGADDEYNDLVYRLESFAREKAALSQARSMLLDAATSVDLAGMTAKVNKIAAFIAAAENGPAVDKNVVRNEAHAAAFPKLGDILVG